MSAGITVNLRSATPPYEQIRGQIAALVAAGALPPGTRLPAVRRLAADLGIAAGTVARAYKELEQSGLLETGRRNGTRVAAAAALPAPAGGPASSATTEVSEAVDRLVAAGRRAGMNDGALLAAVQARLALRDGYGPGARTQ